MNVWFYRTRKHMHWVHIISSSGLCVCEFAIYNSLFVFSIPFFHTVSCVCISRIFKRWTTKFIHFGADYATFFYWFSFFQWYFFRRIVQVKTQMRSQIVTHNINVAIRRRHYQTQAKWWFWKLNENEMAIPILNERHTMCVYAIC